VSPVHDPQGERLQKVLAAAGLGSRRACERLITQGRVRVDGVIVTELGVRVSERAVIHVDDVRIRLDPQAVTLALHKPAGVVSTMADPQGRPTLADYVPGEQRLFHVGRLDEATEGLILLTNDGELAHRLTHPSYEVPKTYVATVKGQVTPGVLRRLQEGIELDDGPAAADRARVLATRPGQSIVELVLHEGRNRIVRRLLGAAGHPVERLVRTEFATIGLGQLRAGETRRIAGRELATLMASVGL